VSGSGRDGISVAVGSRISGINGTASWECSRDDEPHWKAERENPSSDLDDWSMILNEPGEEGRGKQMQIHDLEYETHRTNEV
jgi:hypothetical protein